MKIKRICMTGGTGFVGRSLANRLSAAGYQLRILTRSREASRDNLILLPGVDLVETDIHKPENLERHFADCQAVINLVGILNERGRDGSGFQHAHVALTEKIIAACHARDIPRILHMSALNADAKTGPSYYLRSKGQAEDLLRAETALKVSIFRPSVIFGRQDDFFNRFAKLLRLSPLFFPLACANARFAPVYVEDVSTAFLHALEDRHSYGRGFSLCGPAVYTLQELVQYTAECLDLGTRIIPLGRGLSRLQGAVFDFVPGKPFSTDNFLSATVDSVCEENDLDKLGIHAQALEGVVPTYLCSAYQRARYDVFRQH